MKITQDWLQEHGACVEGRAWFDANYPEGGEAEEIAHRLCEGHMGWATWLAWEARLTVVLRGTYADGLRIEEYWRDGERHRVDGPAVIGTSPDGTRYEEYWQDGKLHRVDGPAAIGTSPDGTRYEEYWRDDRFVEKGAKS